MLTVAEAIGRRPSGGEEARGSGCGEVAGCATAGAVTGRAPRAPPPPRQLQSSCCWPARALRPRRRGRRRRRLRSQYSCPWRCVCDLKNRCRLQSHRPGEPPRGARSQPPAHVCTCACMSVRKCMFTVIDYWSTAPMKETSIKKRPEMVRGGLVLSSYVLARFGYVPPMFRQQAFFSRCPICHSPLTSVCVSMWVCKCVCVCVCVSGIRK